MIHLWNDELLKMMGFTFKYFIFFMVFKNPNQNNP